MYFNNSQTWLNNSIGKQNIVDKGEHGEMLFACQIQIGHVDEYEKYWKSYIVNG